MPGTLIRLKAVKQISICAACLRFQNTREWERERRNREVWHHPLSASASANEITQWASTLLMSMWFHAPNKSTFKFTLPHGKLESPIIQRCALVFPGRAKYKLSGKRFANCAFNPSTTNDNEGHFKITYFSMLSLIHH